MLKDEILFIVDEERELLFDGTTFKEAPSKKKASYFNATVLPSSFIRVHGFKAPTTTTPEKLEVQTEMKMYDEVGLDADTEYKITYQKIDLENEDNFYIESYASELSKLEEKFALIAKRESHIDFLFSAPITYLSLYSFEKLEKKNDVFIYFGDDDAYATIFKQGKYISTRSLPTLNELAQKIGLELEKLKEVFSTKGLNKELYAFEELYSMTIEDELLKIIDRIVQAIVHKSNIFKIDSIDRIYLDFEGSTIPGFLEAFNERGYEEAEKSVLDIFENIEVGMKHTAIKALYALGGASEHYEILNFSIFDRKPPFLKTNVGQFSILMFLSIALATAYPLYAYYQLEDLTLKENSLEADVKKIQLISKKLKVKLKKEKSKKTALTQESVNLLQKIRSYDTMLNVLKNFDKETIERQKMMKDVNIAMKKYHLSSKHLLFSDKNKIKVHIVTKYYERDNIALFISYLIDNGYKHVMTRKIEKKENYYESFVEIQP